MSANHISPKYRRIIRKRQLRLLKMIKKRLDYLKIQVEISGTSEPLIKIIERELEEAIIHAAAKRYR